MTELVIKPGKILSLNWAELKRYRELFYFFAWRDIKVRYKQTVIGAAWAILQPFITMVVFTIFFNKVAGISTGAVPYAIFSYTGLMFWNFFSNALNGTSNSLVNNQTLLTKIYFPRIIMPIAATAVSLVDFFFAAIIFIGLMAYFQILPGVLGLLLFLPMVLVTFIAVTGLGMFLAAINVKYRDVKQALPFMIQILLFITPVIYPVSLVPEQFQRILYLNPMTGVISTMRATLIHQGTVDWIGLAISSGVSVLMLVLGFVYFKRKEREFADIV